MAIKVILTDLDGVIRHFPSQRDAIIERNFGLPAGIIARTAFAHERLQNVITGKTTDEAWRKEIRSKLAAEFGNTLAEKAENKWSESPGEIDRDIFDVLLKFKRGIRLALLTNATSRLRQDLSRLGIWNYFDHIFNSSEVGHAKPNAKIFEYVIRELGCVPAEALFIDDSRTNVQAAAALGFPVLHFQLGATRLEAELKVRFGM